MDSDFRLGLRSSFNNVKVKKDDIEPVKVEPVTTVEIVVSKKETISAPVKVEIVEKKEEIVQEVTEKTEFDSSCTGGDFYAEGVGYLYGDPAALGMYIKSNHLISLQTISEETWNYDITTATDSNTVAGYIKKKFYLLLSLLGVINTRNNKGNNVR